MKYLYQVYRGLPLSLKNLSKPMQGVVMIHGPGKNPGIPGEKLIKQAARKIKKRVSAGRSKIIPVAAIGGVTARAARHQSEKNCCIC
jgi:hypothetical protein